MSGQGVSSRSSHSAAAGRTTFAANPWTQSRTSRWSWLSSIENAVAVAASIGSEPYADGGGGRGGRPAAVAVRAAALGRSGRPRADPRNGRAAGDRVRRRGGAGPGRVAGRRGAGACRIAHTAGGGARPRADALRAGARQRRDAVPPRVPPRSAARPPPARASRAARPAQAVAV